MKARAAELALFLGPLDLLFSTRFRFGGSQQVVSSWPLKSAIPPVLYNLFVDHD